VEGNETGISFVWIDNKIKRKDKKVFCPIICEERWTGQKSTRSKPMGE